MIKNPYDAEWTQEEMKIINDLVRHDFKNTDKDFARTIWKKYGKNFYPNFDDYWKAVINPKRHERRCENCTKYPCPTIQEHYIVARIITICWIFHGSACSGFVRK